MWLLAQGALVARGVYAADLAASPGLARQVAFALAASGLAFGLFMATAGVVDHGFEQRPGRLALCVVCLPLMGLAGASLGERWVRRWRGPSG